MKCLIFLSILLIVFLMSCGSSPIIIDFDDLSDISAITQSNPNPHPVNIGDKFYVEDYLIHNPSNTKIYILPFQWLTNPPEWTRNGMVEIVNTQKAGGTGNEIHFDNACLGVFLSTGDNPFNLKKIVLKFADFGGNINLLTNGILCNSQDFVTIPGNQCANINIKVIPVGNIGRLELKGDFSIFSFSYPTILEIPDYEFSAVIGGGQELWIDEIELHE